MREDLVRPSFWPAYVPVRCPECRSPMLPGKVRNGWEPCQCPGASGKPAGHAMVFRCAARPPGECNAHFWPPEHVAGWTEPAERPRVV